MRAVQYRVIGAHPEVVTIDKPEPGPGQIRLRVTAAGLCHSDEFVMNLPAERYNFPLPMTLGHEGAGVVDALGAGVSGVELGDSVAVYGPWGCGLCHACAQGKENYCNRAAELGIHPPGLGAQGALAEYMIIDDVRHLVPLGDRDPVEAVALTDAGLTPYHAIKAAMSVLTPGSTAVVIGAGGLGHMGIQLLRALTGATIIALDIDKDKLRLATEVGAHHVAPSGPDAPQFIRQLTHGDGAEAVFDFVGIPATVEIARQSIARDGIIHIVGIGGGILPAGFFSIPYGASVRTPYWGSRSELMEVFDLARTGKIKVHNERFTIEQAPEAYERLKAGTILGRAVVVP